MNKPYSKLFIDDNLGAKAKDRYFKRRISLRKKYNFPIIIFGINNPFEKYSHLYQYHPIIQDPIFLFYTGITQINSAILLEPLKETLFLPEIDFKKEFWEGKMLGIDSQKSNQEIKLLTGFNHVKAIQALDYTLITIIKEFQYHKIGMIWNEFLINKQSYLQKDYLYEVKTRIKKLLSKNKLNNVQIINLIEPHLKDRQILDQVDQKNLQIATKYASKAYKALLKKLSIFKTEHQVANFLNFQLNQDTEFGLSFPTICASGKNATILHYTKNDESLHQQDLLLLDFGIRYQNITIDISRTIPISGRFNPLQRILYLIIKNTQMNVEKMVKPGVTIDELNKFTWEHINTLLYKKILKKGGKVILQYKKAPHNVSHLIGIIVHEGGPFRLYSQNPLKPGMLISNEPGLYGIFELTIRGKLYKEEVGIRLEDNLLVTQNGCLNITKSCPK